MRTLFVILFASLLSPIANASSLEKIAGLYDCVLEKKLVVRLSLTKSTISMTVAGEEKAGTVIDLTEELPAIHRNMGFVYINAVAKEDGDSSKFLMVTGLDGRLYIEGDARIYNEEIRFKPNGVCSGINLPQN